jgi:putative sigma-54 modulation protein
VSEKLDRLDKYLDNPAEANVVLAVEKFRHIAEINIAGDRLTIIGSEETNDMYSAIDMALDKLEKQIKKSKQKIRERRSAGKNRNRSILEEADSLPDEDTERQIIEDNFLVFTNARSDRINVLYRRRDGHYGLIQPNS